MIRPQSPRENSVLADLFATKRNVTKQLVENDRFVTTSFKRRQDRVAILECVTFGLKGLGGWAPFSVGRNLSPPTQPLLSTSGAETAMCSAKRPRRAEK